eukprot:UN11684
MLFISFGYYSMILFLHYGYNRHNYNITRAEVKLLGLLLGISAILEIVNVYFMNKVGFRPKKLQMFERLGFLFSNLT